ncbi:VasL domain-containing protein [Pseudomonas graminis]
MTQLSERYLKTGDDPSMLPDYISLHEEMSKLAHSARPDMDWTRVQKLCLALFERNGVELQTAAWYTQVRTQLAGLSGLNEGLAIIEALISHQWEALWPRQGHARVEILSSLSRRIQQLMRTLPISYSDINLSQLYQAEHLLARLNEVLQRRELKHLSQFDVLATLMHNIAVRLEKSDAAEKNSAEVAGNRLAMGTNSTVAKLGVKLPEAVVAPPVPTPKETEEPVKWIYVAQPKAVIQMPFKKMPWKPFAAGMCVMLVAGSAVQFGWDKIFPRDPLLVQLESSVMPLATPLSPAQRQALVHSRPQLAENFVEQTQQQLERVDGYSPDWSLSYGQGLINQLQSFKPEDEVTKQLVQKWQQQLNAAALPVDVMSGWHQGMSQLQQLSAKLNTLDSQRGKYITVSELKSVIYTARQAFNRSVPVEEQLRLYSVSPSDIQKRQTEMALEQLQKRYFLLSQEKGKESP